MSRCYMCPRACGKDRSVDKGICGMGDNMRVARADLHFFEEPIISGTRGSGTVFFCGCSLGCVFCQNRDISRGSELGREISERELADIMLGLEERGAHNINLVTGAHFVSKIATSLEMVKNRLSIPIVYNSSGYELPKTLKMLDGLVDIYLPDYKYFSSELSAKYSNAPDYRERAEAAILEMFGQVGKCEYNDEGLLKKGIIIRHLVLPSSRADSIAVVRRIAEILPKNDILISVMSQYTPDFASDVDFKELHRRVTRFEYDSVLQEVQRLGLSGFSQAKESASGVYTPDFKGNTGVKNSN